MTVYAVANNKGGVSKTYTTFHLAGALAARRGQRVLVIDLDPQASLTGLFRDDRDARPSAYDVLVEHTAPLDALYSTPFDGISILPSHHLLERLDPFLQQEPDGQVRLADALAEIPKDRFDVVLIDCPPSLGLATQNALAAADRVIIPAEPDKFSYEGIGRVEAAIQGIRRAANPRLKVAGILISLVTPNRKVDEAYARALLDHSLPCFKTQIKRSTRYREAAAARTPITGFLPESEHAAAFERLADELLNRKRHAKD